MARILVIENQSLLGKWIGLNLADAGHIVIQVRQPEDAHAQIQTSSPDLVIFNTGLPAAIKGAYVRRWRQLRPETRIIDITDELEAGASAGSSGADALVPIPFMMERLIEIVDGLLDKDES